MDMLHAGPTRPLNPDAQHRRRGNKTCVHHERLRGADRPETGRMVMEQRLRRSMPSWRIQETEPVMATATLIISQYLYGNPGWDGSKTVEAIRNMVIRMLRWLIVVAGMAMSLAACSTVPTMTRTGSVQDIVIGPSSLHLNVTVHKGDEVRWVNERDGIIQIIFLDSLEGQVNCKRGFGLPDITDTTTLKPQESVSLCFAEPGSWPYTVRLNRPAPTGWVNVPGRIMVEDLVDGG